MRRGPNKHVGPKGQNVQDRSITTMKVSYVDDSTEINT